MSSITGALTDRLRLLARRVLMRLAYPPCTEGRICRAVVEHDEHSIRDVCLLCGRRGAWVRVVMETGDEDSEHGR